ncbi:MAG: insulinase family protein [Clostridia bacterium]|nr:insulinase family protein [Clostridia bacterium]
MKTEWFESARLNEKYCRISLPGRPKVYVFPKQMSNTYALCAVRYGSVDRSYQCVGGKKIILPDGIAHFLEHKMFTEQDGSDAFDIFSSYGADANAYTTYDRTVYLFNCTSNFDKSFGTLLHMVTHPYFTKESVDRERGIIAQEIGMYDDDPDAVCYENMLATLYHDHPVRINVCGTVQSIAKITPELLYECHRTFYNPDNMVIIVCGQVTPESIIDAVMCETGWGETVAFERCVDAELCGPAQKVITRKMKVAMPLFAMGFKENDIDADVLSRHRRDITASILERMLFSTSSELYNELYDKGLVTSPLSVGRAAEDSYAFTELCGTAKDPSAVCEYIMSHIRKIHRIGLTYDDFVRCQRRRLGDAISRFDSTEEIANALIGYAFDELDILNDVELVESIDFDEVKNLFEKMYHEDNMAVSYVMPLK